MLRVDIPNIEDIPNEIRETKITDFCIALGAETDDIYDRTSWYLTKNIVYDRILTIKSDNGDIYNCDSIDNYHATRPIILFDDIKEVAPNGIIERDENGIGIIEFGYWPKDVPGEGRVFQKDLLRTLSLWSNRVDHTTNEKYRVCIDSKFQTLRVIEYNGKKYVSVTTNFWKKKSRKLSDNSHYEDGDNILIEVAPVKWYVDEKNKKMLAVDALFSGVTLSKTYLYDGNPDYMLKYLNNFFIKDLTQGIDITKNINVVKEESKDIEEKPNVNGLNERSKKINEIINEIYDLLDTYHGDEDIRLKVKKLIENYNKDINNAIQNKRQRFNLPSEERYDLSLDNYKDENSLYLYLITEIEDIRTKLKLSSEKYKVHNEVLELIDICINILDDTGNRDDYLDDLKDDIMTIKMVVLPFLEDEKYILELKALFLREKQEVLSYLKGNDNSLAKTYKSLNDFELKFRSKLAAYLQDLNKAVRNKDLIKQIREGYQSIILDNYKDGSNKYLNHLFAEIGALVVEILDKGTTEEKIKMRSIYNRPIDYEGDIINTLKEIDETYKSLYRIVLDIKEREDLERELEDYRVEIKEKGFRK